MKALLLLTLAFTLVTATAFAAPVADGTLRGRTSQGYKASVLVQQGKVDFIVLPFKARRCTPRNGYAVRFPRFNWQNNPNGHGIEQSADGRRFTDAGRVVVGKRGNRSVVDAKLSGHFESDDKVVGTQRAVIHSNDRYGKHRCVAKVRFSAKR